VRVSSLLRLLLASVLVFGLSIRLAIAWQPWERLISTGTFGDDACYYASISYNIATGKGPTTDGIHMTNGFQPLWAFLLVPIYALGASKETAINIAMTLLALISTLNGLLLFLLATRVWNERVGLLATFFWMTSPTVLRQSMNGMETGLYVFMLTLAALLVVSSTQKHEALCEGRSGKLCGETLLGFVLGMVILSRVDGLPFVLSAVVAHTLNANEARVRMRNASQALVFRVASGAFTLAVVLLTLLPWLIYSVITTGKVMPESGRAIRCLSMAYIDALEEGASWRAISYSLSQALSTLLRVRQWRYLSSKLAELVGAISAHALLASLLAVCTLLIAFLYRLGYFERLVPMLKEMRKLWFWLFHIVSLFLAYSLYQFGWWFFPRYFFPVIPIGILVGALFVEALFRCLLERFGVRRCVAQTAVGIVVISQLIQLCIGCAYLRSESFGGFEEYLNVALWLKEHTPKDARIGMFQSGTSSYLSERTVINLDGVVNGEALSAMLGKRMLGYIASEGISYIADWDELIELLLLKRSRKEELSKWVLVRVRRGEMSVYKLVRVK
jgi:hypothetical protein